MKTTVIYRLLAVALLVLAGYGLWRLGMTQGMQMAGLPSSQHQHSSAANTDSSQAGSAEQATDEIAVQDPATWTIPQGEAATRRHMEQGIKAGDIDPVTGLKVLYYHDPMVPGRQFDAPSKSPFMDMMLVPEYAGAGGGDSSSVTISSRVQQNLGIRIGKASLADIAMQTTVDGAVTWNERERSVIQARAEGYVEKLHVSATLDSVRIGQPLITVYVPDWVAAQQEYLALKKMQASGLEPLLEAARQRMLQLGMTQAQINQFIRSGTVQPRIAITSPRDGVITRLEVREGMTMKPGMTLMEINGIDTVWLEAQVPEAQVFALTAGTAVTATTAAHPGKVFEGTVQTILPQVNANTRTVQARLSIQNTERSLIPGLFMKVKLSAGKTQSLLTIPTEAIFYTGERAMVIALSGENSFTPVQVKTGIEVGSQTEILSGLSEGDAVVLSGQFLVDSEASLRGLEARLLSSTEQDATEQTQANDLKPTYSTVVTIDDLNEPGMPMMTHPPIEALKWPGMTMQFQFASPEMERDILTEKEYRIEFQLQDGDVPLITKIEPSSPIQGGKP